MERAQLFGSDLQLSERVGGLDLFPTDERDLGLARGNDNIVQALILRLKVRRGELARLGYPDYGSRLHELIGEPNTPRIHQKLMAFAREAIEPDPRVREVTEVRAAVLEREEVRLFMEIQLIDSPNPLNLVYDVSLENQP